MSSSFFFLLGFYGINLLTELDKLIHKLIHTVQKHPFARRQLNHPLSVRRVP